MQTKTICQFLNARQNVDTQPTQLITARSALSSRRAALIRAATNVTNAETRLRGLINAPELQTTDVLELCPADAPALIPVSADKQTQIATALQTRPELTAAIRKISAASRRMGIARHELMPAMNLVLTAYTAGLRGENNFTNAFTDQFSGTPGYSIGMQYEVPTGNRAAKARVCRRQHELTQLRSEYARAIEVITTEVDVASREVNTTWAEISAKSQALLAAETDVKTIDQRWRRMIDGPGTAGLNLESLLRAQERKLAAEREYAESIVAYNMALLQLKRATGTLLQAENICVSDGTQKGCNTLILSKGAREQMAAPVGSAILNPTPQ